MNYYDTKLNTQFTKDFISLTLDKIKKVLIGNGHL